MLPPEITTMYERFTDRARKVMQLANQEAQRFNHEYIGTEHILLGLIKEGSGVAANVLKNLDVDLRKVRREVEKMVHCGPDLVHIGKLPQTPRAKKVIEYAIEEARNINHNYVGTEHLLLGLLREQIGVGAQVLMNLGLKLEDVREEILNLLGHNMAPQSAAKAKGTFHLERVCAAKQPAPCPVKQTVLSVLRPANLGIFLGGLGSSLAGAALATHFQGYESAGGGALAAGILFVAAVACWPSRK
jgi:ATP-dependent Clp protease ATP-binding subunit ClpC